MKSIYILSSSILFFVWACSSENRSGAGAKPPITESLTLNNFVQSAPFQVINIDGIDSIKISLKEENIIYSVYQKLDDTDPILGDIWDAIKVNNKIYVYDFSSKAIYSIDTKGEINGPFTREGRGPGEHLGVGVIRANLKNIYATDPNNGRINRYTLDMKVLSSIPLQVLRTIELNNEILIFENNGISKEENLLTITSVENVYDTLATIMPRIVPIGYEPSLYNNLLFSVNSSGVVIASYSAFPWIFIFDDDYQHVQTLLFEYSSFDSLNVPEFKLEKKPSSKRYNLQRPFVYHRLMDNGDIYIGIEEELIYLTPDGEGKYKTRKILVEQFENANNASIMVIGTSKDTVYAKNAKYLYDFTISLD
ncbi:MAG: 6-bladed beta-propeller [Balneolaceae bacterium]